jgi:hypothetical protein
VNTSTQPPSSNNSPEWPFQLYQKILEDIAFATRIQLYTIYLYIAFSLLMLIVEKKTTNILLLQKFGVFILLVSISLLWLFYFIIRGHKKTLLRLQSKYQISSPKPVNSGNQSGPPANNIFYPILGTVVVLIFFNLSFPEFIPENWGTILKSLKKLSG